MKSRSSLALPYLAYGFVTGAWVPFATVDRTAFETISVGTAWPLGGLLAVLLLRHLTSHIRVATTAIFGAIATASIILASGVVLAIAAIAVSVTSQAFFGLRRNATPTTKLVSLGPFTMIGGLLGITVFSFADAWAIVLPSLSFAYFAWTNPKPESPKQQRRSWPITKHATFVGLLVSAAAWGFIPLAATITEQEAGRVWVIPQMAAYVAGALLAGPLNRRLPAKPFVLAGLMALAGASWIAPLVTPGIGILAARFISGAALFIVQGRVEVLAINSGSGDQPDNLAAIKASLSVGAAISGLWVGLTTETGLFSAAWTSTIAGLITCIVLLTTGRHTQKANLQAP